MVNNQKKYLKTSKKTLNKDEYVYHFLKEEYKNPVIKETWNPEVANFYMDLYPSLIEEGNNISDLQQRASFEALTRRTEIASVEEFFKIIEKISPKK